MKIKTIIFVFLLFITTSVFAGNWISSLLGKNWQLYYELANNEKSTIGYYSTARECRRAKKSNKVKPKSEKFNYLGVYCLNTKKE